MESLNPHKNLKEQFVSNLTGSSKLETFFLITNISALILVRHCTGYNWISSVDSVKKDDNAAGGGKNVKAYVLTLMVDYLVIAVPCVLFMTVLAEWTRWNTIMVLLLLLFLRLLERNRACFLQKSHFDSIRAYISSYRVLMMLSTCISILAVDFKIFPRRYAKTETYGTSMEEVQLFVSLINLSWIIILAFYARVLSDPADHMSDNWHVMDLGVGSFVLANALVSGQARGLFNKPLGNVLRSSGPLIVLGFARLISTSSVNYQVLYLYPVSYLLYFFEFILRQGWKTLHSGAIFVSSVLVTVFAGIYFAIWAVHVGEYGVHWNFFFTLAAVAILTSVIRIHPHYCVIVGSIVLIGYQASLLSGLNEYLLSEERGADIFSQNKEGILSIFGYWGLYLIGVGIGNYLFFRDNADATSKTVNCTRIRVWALCLFFWSIAFLLDRYVEKVSRRMCNLAYVSLTLASNLQVLAIIMLSDHACGSISSALEEAFNRNLLASFLLANVLTGMVNLCVDTLSVSSASAVGILLAYTFVLCFSIGFADFLCIKLKFW